MATRVEEYKGKTITVNADEVSGGYVWSYQIDGGPIRRCKDRALNSEELMLSEGVSTAKAGINGYPAP